MDPHFIRTQLLTVADLSHIALCNVPVHRPFDLSVIWWGLFHHKMCLFFEHILEHWCVRYHVKHTEVHCGPNQ